MSAVDESQPDHLLPYPPDVDRSNERDRLRWDMSVAVAMQTLDAPADSAEVWSAARVIYRSDIPT